MRRSKTLEFMNNLNEKINKDNIEINKAIANPNLGKNKDRIKQAGYDIDYDGDYIKNPKTGKGIWPKDYSKDEKKKIDFKGKLDSERKPMSKTNRYNWDQEENKIPKSAKIGSKNNGGIFNNDEVEYYSPNWADAPKKSISTNINFYKRAVKDRDDAKKSAESSKKSLGYYEKKVKDAQNSLDWQKDYIKSKEKEADWAEQKRKELIAKTKEKKSATVKEGAEPIIKGLKKKLKESVDEDFVNNAYDLIGDYLYNETGRDEVSWGEIKDYIYNDVCDDELHDYNPSKETMEAIKQRLKNGGYKVLEEQEKKDIENKIEDKEKENNGLSDKIKATPIKDLTGEEAHKIEQNDKEIEDLKDKLKDETLTEARQEEILSKLSKKKMNEESENLEETTNKGIEQRRKDLYSRTRQKLKDAGDKNWENLINLKDRLSPEDLENYYKEYDEISTIEMIHSILTYSPKENWNVDYIMENKYMNNYIDKLGEDKVRELAQQEVDEYINNAIVNQDVYTDSEGVSYNSITFKNESEKVYSEQGEEQQLNEETVGEKITSPSGKFYVGDPCYVLSDDIYYGIWDDKYDFKDGKIDVDDTLSFLVHGTAYGDGSYQGSNGSEYGVDSGTLAIIPMDLVAKLDGVQFGSVETSNTAWLDYNDGTFDITLDNGSFSIITSEDEEEEDDE